MSSHVCVCVGSRAGSSDSYPGKTSCVTQVSFNQARIWASFSNNNVGQLDVRKCENRASITTRGLQSATQASQDCVCVCVWSDAF